MWIFTKPTHNMNQEGCQNEPGGLLVDLTIQNFEKIIDGAQIWTLENSSQIGPCFPSKMALDFFLKTDDFGVKFHLKEDFKML